MHRRPQFEPLARLAAAGCGLFGPWVLRGLYCPAGRGCSGPSSRVGALILPGAAAAALAAGALLGGCAAWDWAGCVAIVSRGCVCPGGCSCAGIGRRALLGWLCPYNLGEHCTAPADMLRLHGTLPASFPLINNRPLSEGAAGGSRLGEGGYMHLSLWSR